jgi:dTDP-4-dehydrorhamnose 3,5-epimerase
VLADEKRNARGSVIELFDQLWDGHPDPIEYAYCFTVRPGFGKGWGLHRHHERP